MEQLGHTKLKAVKGSIEKFLGDIGVNAGVEDSLRQKQYSNFRNKVKSSIHEQIDRFATTDKIAEVSQSAQKAIDPNFAIAVGATWYSWNIIFDDWESAFLTYLMWAGNQGGKTGLGKMIPNAEPFDLKNLEIKNIFSERISFVSKTVDRTTINWVAGEISKGIEAGLSIEEIARDIRSKAEKVAIDRSAVIAETELVNAFSLVELETFKKNQIGEVKWVTSMDERVCPICMGNETQGYVPIDTAFSSRAKHPPAHIGCRCYLLPKLPSTIDKIIWRGR